MVHATIVPVPKQRNSREENETVKRGETLPAWEEKPAKPIGPAPRYSPLQIGRAHSAPMTPSLPARARRLADVPLGRKRNYTASRAKKKFAHLMPRDDRSQFSYGACVRDMRMK